MAAPGGAPPAAGGNLEVCVRCHEGGDALLACDGCPRSYCLPCYGVTEAPLEDPWHCGKCHLPVPRDAQRAHKRALRAVAAEAGEAGGGGGGGDVGGSEGAAEAAPPPAKRRARPAAAAALSARMCARCASRGTGRWHLPQCQGSSSGGSVTP